MDLLGSLVTFTMFWKLSWSLQCYVCQQCPVQFNDSIRHKYLKECKQSTMCFKRVSTLDFGNGLTSQNTQRDCAAQTQDGEQKKIKGKWVQMNNIHEVYDETCFDDPNNDERSTNSILCYCRGDQCNGATVNRGFIGLIVVTIAILKSSLDDIWS